mmetsp:Transcript_15225/g.29239  ORF Transcript_15225/g.29239 Transcript_15225/m.29239 type:complete len:212 (+) Transcript_15225:861-1496(+)
MRQRDLQYFCRMSTARRYVSTVRMITLECSWSRMYASKTRAASTFIRFRNPFMYLFLWKLMFKPIFISFICRMRSCLLLQWRWMTLAARCPASRASLICLWHFSANCTSFTRDSSATTVAHVAWRWCRRTTSGSTGSGCRCLYKSAIRFSSARTRACFACWTRATRSRSRSARSQMRCLISLCVANSTGNSARCLWVCSGLARSSSLVSPP